MKRIVTAVIAALALGALTSCGEASALEQTQANMAKLTSGDIDLQLSATAGTDDDATGPVGFRLKGPYSTDGKTELAVFDLTYTQLLGSGSKTMKISSTGREAFVDTGDDIYRVPKSQLAPLRLDDNPSGGINDLGIAGWVRNPKTTKANGAERIRGQVDVPDLLSDLARVAGGLGGDNALRALGGDAGERLQELVKSSSIEVVTGAKDHELRSLRALVNFGTRAPVELRKTLGKYARAQLEVRLSMNKLTRALKVDAPE